MAERGSCGTTNDRGASEDDGPVTGSSGVRRVVPLRPAARPSEPAPVWAEPGWIEPELATGAWTPDLDEAEPFGGEWPFEPDPEAAAFLNAPRRPLAFYVAPFGTPPFGNPPSVGARPSRSGPSGSGAAGGRSRSGSPVWGEAYPAGA